MPFFTSKQAKNGFYTEGSLFVEKNKILFLNLPKIKRLMARDLFHYNVREALEKESWHITNDPLQNIIVEWIE
jgi:XisH protein